jgi:uncharacterized protein (DUF1501 family)
MNCDDCTRANFLRAAAGRGLPAIEPGMPLPAGTGLSRRSFLLRSGALGLSVYGASLLGPRAFEQGIENAMAGTNGRVLVSIFMPGGADALSMLYPVGDPDYGKLRSSLRLSAGAGRVFTEDDRLHWHPSLTPLADLHREGKVTVFPAIGYTNADQSHFTSRHYWETGGTDAGVRTGWMGRYLDAVGSPDNPLQGLSLDGSLNPTLATLRNPVAAIDGGASYTLSASHVSDQVEQRMHEALASLGALGDAGDAWRSVAATVTRQSNRLREQLQPFADSGVSSPVAYPDDKDSGFAGQLSGLAAMLAAGLPLKCVALSAPGEYDTHADQPDALAGGLDITASCLHAFQRDLEARGLDDRVLVHVWSEFGRRAEQNASDGTDHGAAGTGFLIGRRAGGRMVGEFPGLREGKGLDPDGNLVATSDFRSVYSALLEQWFEFDAAQVIQNAASFARPKLVS